MQPADGAVATGRAKAGPDVRIPTGVSLAALSLGGLAIGTTEFARMGVAPLIALAAASWPRKRLVVLLAVVLVAFNALSAVAPSFLSFVLLRFISGLPHATPRTAPVPRAGEQRT